MSVDDSESMHHDAKANLDHIYNQPDPRAYYSELRKLDYATPSAGKPLFLKLISRLQGLREKSIRVLDLGCSYGVNGALLKHDMTMPQLYDHWGQDRLQDVSPEEVMEHDRRYFADREESHGLEVIGLDRAERAVAFAEETGLIDEGVVANLEAGPLLDSAMPELAGIDLMTSTGCIGYVTEKTFERLLPTVTRAIRPGWPTSCSGSGSSNPLRQRCPTGDMSPRSSRTRHSSSGVSSAIANAIKCCSGSASGASIRRARKPMGICTRSSSCRDQPATPGKFP